MSARRKARDVRRYSSHSRRAGTGTKRGAAARAEQRAGRPRPLDDLRGFDALLGLPGIRPSWFGGLPR